jgi:hypothetical protein
MSCEVRLDCQTRLDASLRPRQPVRQPCLSGQAQGIRHDLLDKPKGELLGNAPTESWFNSFKTERVHGIRYATHADMKAPSFEYIEVFYNRKRQHSTLGYRSPIQFLENWISEQHQQKRVA